MTWAPDRAWVQRAACRDKPTRLFTDPQTDSDVRTALATCQRCPVRQPCLTTALNHRPQADVGIWGGTTEAERRHLRAGRLQPGVVIATPPDTGAGTTAANPLQARDEGTADGEAGRPPA